MQNNMGLKIAITGGIGSGKSTVAKIIKSLGYPVFSCDDICKDLYKKQSVLRKLKTLFPTAISGKLYLSADKKIISNLTFNDEENHKKLSNFLQPLIVDNLLKKMKKIKGLCFSEVPLLFEGNYTSLFDKVIVVVRDKKERINAVYDRSNLTEDDFNKIASRQVDYDKFDLSSYIVIENNGDINSLKEKVENTLKTLI